MNGGSGPVAVASPERVTDQTELLAAMRLVSVPPAEREGAARRLLAAGPRHGIDFTHAWAVIDRAPGGEPRLVRQVCLAVPGSGRTAMVFLSDPVGGAEPGGPEVAKAERAACIQAAAADMATLVDAGGARRVAVMQALPEPREAWSIEACHAAGFVTVGHLTYMRASVPPLKRQPPAPTGPFPAGVEVVSVASIPAARREAVLVEALERSYEETLDCPELCGMRETRDILESHRCTGVHDPSMWWVVFDGSSPRGTMMLAHVPDQHAVELVYLGLSPDVRGKGLGRRLMAMAMRATAAARIGEMTCAVDTRNVPAVRLYESCGFAGFAQRVALVKSL
ncbi:MAG: hypothetical protein AMXMBFR58_12600 [Phycisphaerae bacterium]